MARAYRNPREHLDDALSLVSQLVERQIVAHWELGILPRYNDEFSGQFVSQGEVDALLTGGHAASQEGKDKISNLDNAIVARSERMEGRLQASSNDGTPMPFDELRAAFGLSATEQRALLILAGIELNPRLRQLTRYLVNEAQRIYPDVGLLEILVYSSLQTRDALITEMSSRGALFRHGLIEEVPGKRPFLLRQLQVRPRILEWLHGVRRLSSDLLDISNLEQSPPSGDELLVADSLLSEVHGLFNSSREQLAPMVILSGKEGSGRKSLIQSAAHQHGCDLLHVSCDKLPQDIHGLRATLQGIVRESILLNAAIVLHNVSFLEPSGENAARLSTVDVALRDYVGPLFATSISGEQKPLRLSRGCIVLPVPIPTEGQRKILWNRYLPEESIDTARIAARYPTTGGVIQRAAQSALSLAQSSGEPLNERHIHLGLRGTLDSQLSNLGVRIDWRQTWDDLVLTEETMEEIREFIGRMRHRRKVYEEWGFARKVAKGLGLSALFAGPPGTGKTMVAGIIADELGLDLYQIDLSRIVSKYVGETEKNLAQLFDAAEAGHAILLFDEADSLFAKRTEVKSSVDRYANLEVNYLLQRMEAFNGISLLTTNLDSSIDDAFKRRISFRINFPMPEPEHRIKLWQSMIPNEAEISDNVDYERLAERYEMTGGYIRNAVLRAAFLAAEDESEMTMRHFLIAANLEYTAMGKVIPSGMRDV